MLFSFYSFERKKIDLMQIWLKNISLLSNIKMLFAVFRASIIMVPSIVEKNEVNKVHVNNACIVI